MRLHKAPKATYSYTVIENATVQAITNPDALAIWTYLETLPNDAFPVADEEVMAHFRLSEERYRDAMAVLDGYVLTEEAS